MAEVQESGPLAGQPFTDADWRDVLGGEAAIVGDTTGQAFWRNLPSGSDVAEFGSTTQRSIAVVGGYRLVIPAGSTQSLTIPPSTNASVGRTDVITARLDIGTYTTTPGPVRLYRHAGTEGSASIPGVDEGAPGVEMLPLWAITRKQGQTLNQATVVDLRQWAGPSLVVAAGRNLPSDVPLGTRARRGTAEYVRHLVGSSPQWVNVTAQKITTAQIDDIEAYVENMTPGFMETTSFGSSEAGFSTGNTVEPSHAWRYGKLAGIRLIMRSGSVIKANDNTGGISDKVVFTITSSIYRPKYNQIMTFKYYAPTTGNTYLGGGEIRTNGDVIIQSLTPGADIRSWPSTGNPGVSMVITATYPVS